MGRTRSCGCVRKETASLAGLKKRLPFGVAGRNDVLSMYKAGAFQREYTWGISDEQFDSLVTSPCHYCGALPSNVKRKRTFHGDFVYSGIDRVDNTVGYLSNNVVPCCTLCNRMKSTMECDVFLNHIEKIHQCQKIYKQTI